MTIQITEQRNIVSISDDGTTVTVSPASPGMGYGLSGAFLTGQTVAVSLTTASASMSLDTVMSASYSTLTSVSLAAGTWLVIAHASAGAANLGAALIADFMYGIRIYDGSTTLASAHEMVPTSVVTTAQLSSSSCSALVTLASTTTISLQGASSSGATFLSFYTQSQGIVGTPVANATAIRAIRIA